MKSFGLWPSIVEYRTAALGVLDLPSTPCSRTVFPSSHSALMLCGQRHRGDTAGSDCPRAGVVEPELDVFTAEVGGAHPAQVVNDLEAEGFVRLGPFDSGYADEVWW